MEEKTNDLCKNATRVNEEKIRLLIRDLVLNYDLRLTEKDLACEIIRRTGYDLNATKQTIREMNELGLDYCRTEIGYYDILKFAEIRQYISDEEIPP